MKFGPEDPRHRALLDKRVNERFAFTALLGSIVSEASAQTAHGNANVRRDPALPEVAPGSPAGVFGAKGQWTISSDAGLSISNTSVSGVDGSATRLELRPSLDYFVSDNLSVGSFIGVDYSSDPGGHATTFAIGPRVGYNLAFSERFSVWLKLGFSYTSTSVSEDVSTPGSGTTVTASDSSSGLALNLFVPVMFHPVPHFFLGFGTGARPEPERGPEEHHHRGSLDDRWLALSPLVPAGSPLGPRRSFCGSESAASSERSAVLVATCAARVLAGARDGLGEQ